MIESAAHEMGHLLYAFSKGKETVQIDFQWVSLPDRNIDAAARISRRMYLDPENTAASGFAGTIAQCLYQNESIRPAEAYAKATDIARLSATDRQSIEAIPESKREEIFDRTFDIIKNSVKFLREQTHQLVARTVEAFEAGENSVGFLYQNPNPIPRKVAILASLF